jgi:hypothetical protein
MDFKEESFPLFSHARKVARQLKPNDTLQSCGTIPAGQFQQAVYEFEQLFKAAVAGNDDKKMEFVEAISELMFIAVPGATPEMAQQTVISMFGFFKDAADRGHAEAAQRFSQAAEASASLGFDVLGTPAPATKKPATKAPRPKI